jgi:hypothetical protein
VTKGAGVIVFLFIFAFLLMQIEACVDKNRRIDRVIRIQKETKNDD